VLGPAFAHPGTPRGRVALRLFRVLFSSNRRRADGRCRELAHAEVGRVASQRGSAMIRGHPDRFRPLRPAAGNHRAVGRAIGDLPPVSDLARESEVPRDSDAAPKASTFAFQRGDHVELTRVAGVGTVAGLPAIALFSSSLLATRAAATYCGFKTTGALRKAHLEGRVVPVGRRGGGGNVHVERRGARSIPSRRTSGYYGTGTFRCASMWRST